MDIADMQQSSQHGSHGHAHQMFFSLVTDSVLLVKSWTTASLVGMLAASVTGAVLSLCLEGLKTYSFSHKLAFHLFKAPSTRFSMPKRVFTSFLHILDVSLAYIVMLLVMTFNAYILISIITGAGLGHFFFRPLFLGRINARLQRRQRVLQILNFPSEEPVCVNCTEESSGDADDSKTNGTFSITSKEKEKKSKAALATEDFDYTECRQFEVKGKETCV